MSIDAALLDQFTREAAQGIGDILHALAAPVDVRPDLLVVDPAVVPLWQHAVTFAAELSLSLPPVIIHPTAGLHALLDARHWSRAANPSLDAEHAPLDWLATNGHAATAAFLAGLAQRNGHGPQKVLAVGGPRDSELPYVARPPEEITIGAGQSVELTELFLTPNYLRGEDGPLDLQQLGKQAIGLRTVILERLHTPAA